MTLRTLIDSDLESSTLTELSSMGSEGAVKVTAVSYESDGFTVTGVLRVPDGPGPHPAVVVVHGFVDDTYTSGSELVREQQHLATNGWIVLATDLRSFGGSDIDPDTGLDLDMGATVDVVTAARTLADDPRVDPDRVVLLGHSLGGLVVLNASVVDPGTLAGVIALAPSSTDVWANVNQFLSPGDPAWEAIVTPHGTADDNPEFWADVSPRTFVDRAADPVLIVHGGADDVIGPESSAITADIWTKAGRDVTLVEIPDADHVLDPHWDQAIAAVDEFLAAL